MSTLLLPHPTTPISRRTSGPALPLVASLLADGAPWGRFGELFAYREDRGVLTPE